MTDKLTGKDNRAQEILHTRDVTIQRQRSARRILKSSSHELISSRYAATAGNREQAPSSEKNGKQKTELGPGGWNLIHRAVKWRQSSKISVFRLEEKYLLVVAQTGC